jgi:hypothetical protein
MSNQGFAKIRNGIKRHIEGRDGIKAKVGSTALGVYVFLHLYCEYDTGIYRGNVHSIATTLGDPVPTVRDALKRLYKRGFINFKATEGKGAMYDILIDKFEPTFGVFVDHRLNAWTNKEVPTAVYEKVKDERELDVSSTSDQRETDVRPTPHSQTSKQPNTQTPNDSTASSSSSGVPPTQRPSHRITEPYVPGSKPNGSTPAVDPVPQTDAMNLVDQFKDKSKHWKFGQKGSKAEAAMAFARLLADHPEAEISDVIDYAAEHEMYGTAMRTVSKKFNSPWEWFAKTYDEIKAHMDDDAEYAKRVAARIAKKKEAIKAAVETATGAAEKDPMIVDKKHGDGSVTKEIKRKAKTKEENDLLLDMMQRPRANQQYISQFLMEEK